MTRRSRSPKWYIDALDEGDVVVRATKESFEQWERCQSSSAAADCAIPAGQIIAEKTEKRETITRQSKRSRSSSSVASPSFGTLGVDYIRVAPPGRQVHDNELGVANAFVSQSTKIIASSVMVLCGGFCMLRSKRNAAGGSSGRKTMASNGSLMQGIQQKSNEGQKRERSFSHDNISSDCGSPRVTSSNGREADRTRNSIGTPNQISRNSIDTPNQISPDTPPHLVLEDRPMSCPAAAMDISRVDDDVCRENSNEDCALSFLVSSNVPFTPQRTSKSKKEELPSSSHAMTLPSKHDANHMVSLISDRFDIKKEDVGKILVKELFKENRERRRMDAEDRRHKENISAIRGEISLEEQVLTAKMHLQDVARRLIWGCHLVHCVILSLSTRAIFPVARKAWECGNDQDAVATLILTIASNFCGCSNNKPEGLLESPSLFKKILPSISSVSLLPSYLSRTDLVMCFLQTAALVLSVVVTHRLMMLFHASQTAHNALNLALCCFVVVRLAVQGSTQSTASLIFQVTAGIFPFNAFLSIVLRIIVLSRRVQLQILCWLYAGKACQMEAEIHLFSSTNKSFIVIASIFAIWVAIASVA